MKIGALITSFIILTAPLQAEEVADFVLVKKSERMLLLFNSRELVGEYEVTLGADPIGHKANEGDERTPEGRYTLDFKLEDSAFYKAIHISYPNEQDRKQAESRGVDPGGDIMIHGQKNGFGWLSFVTQRFNWTDGCIAVTNSDMDEIWRMVPEGTPIEIRK